jgi:hypothetical protein
LCSTARDDINQLEAIAGCEIAGGKPRWRQCLAVVFYHDTSRVELLLQRKVVYCARESDLDWFPVCDDDWRVHKFQSGLVHGGQDGVPILPNGLISETSDQIGDFLW